MWVARQRLTCSTEEVDDTIEYSYEVIGDTLEEA